MIGRPIWADYTVVESTTGKRHIRAGEGIDGTRTRCERVLKNFPIGGMHGVISELEKNVDCKACLSWARRTYGALR